MQSLLEHGEANGISPFLCALERDHAEWKTCDTGREMRLFVQGLTARRLIWFAGNGIARKRGVRCS